MSRSTDEFWNETFDLEEKFGAELLSGSLRGFPKVEESTEPVNPAQTMFPTVFIGCGVEDRHYLPHLMQAWTFDYVHWLSDVIEHDFGERWFDHLDRLWASDAALLLVSGNSFARWGAGHLEGMFKVAQKINHPFWCILLPGLDPLVKVEVANQCGASIIDVSEVPETYRWNKVRSVIYSWSDREHPGSAFRLTRIPTNQHSSLTER